LAKSILQETEDTVNFKQEKAHTTPPPRAGAAAEPFYVRSFHGFADPEFYEEYDISQEDIEVSPTTGQPVLSWGTEPI